MTEYTALYQRLSNNELLTILAESEKYNPIAVETARKEIESRQLSEDELSAAQSKIAQKKNVQKRQTEKRREREEKIKENTATIFDTLNPIQNGIQTPEKIIRLTVILFGALAIYNLYDKIGIIRFMFTYTGGTWDLSMVEYFFPIILLPIALLLFWKRKRVGWLLLSIFLVYTALNLIILFFMNLGRGHSGIPALEEIFPTIHSVFYLMALPFIGGFLYLICKQEVRSIFKVSKEAMLLTIALTVIVNSIFVYSIFRL